MKALEEPRLRRAALRRQAHASMTGLLTSPNQGPEAAPVPSESGSTPPHHGGGAVLHPWL